MAYTDKDYFLTKIKETELNNLILDDAEAPTDSYLTDAIISADSVIDYYLRKVYTVPLVTVPAMIRQISYYIATYFLHDRIQYNQIPDRVKDNYDSSIFTLKDISMGKAQLPDIPDDDTDAFIDFDSNESLFDRYTF